MDYEKARLNGKRGNSNGRGGGGRGGGRGRGGGGGGNYNAQGGNENYKKKNLQSLNNWFGSKIDQNEIERIFKEHDFDTDKAVSELSFISGIEPYDDISSVCETFGLRKEKIDFGEKKTTATKIQFIFQK